MSTTVMTRVCYPNEQRQVPVAPMGFPPSPQSPEREDNHIEPYVARAQHLLQKPIEEIQQMLYALCKESHDMEKNWAAHHADIVQQKDAKIALLEKTDEKLRIAEADLESARSEVTTVRRANDDLNAKMKKLSETAGEDAKKAASHHAAKQKAEEETEVAIAKAQKLEAELREQEEDVKQFAAKMSCKRQAREDFDGPPAKRERR